MRTLDTAFTQNQYSPAFLLTITGLNAPTPRRMASPASEERGGTRSVQVSHITREKGGVTSPTLKSAFRNKWVTKNGEQTVLSVTTREARNAIRFLRRKLHKIPLKYKRYLCNYSCHLDKRVQVRHYVGNFHLNNNCRQIVML